MNKNQELKMKLLDKFCQSNDINGINLCREAYKFLNEDDSNVCETTNVANRFIDDEGLPMAGAYIETIDGRLFTANEWKDCGMDNKEANCVTVINGVKSVRVALQEGGKLNIHSSHDGKLEKYMSGMIDVDDAENDFNGVENTKNILKFNDGDEYAAGFCNIILLPDNKTKCHLPSLGEMRIIRFYKKQVQKCLSACGGVLLQDELYWTSTFGGVFDDGFRPCWAINWLDNEIRRLFLDIKVMVRPVATYA